MNGEQTPLARRAALHAALGDPARLRIVDLLSLGDLSPRELQDKLGMPSNLVAHHLATLERAGVITRSRSEADRRRSYIRLAPSALDGLGPSATSAARRVLFVCTANSARSQLAARLWEQRSGVPAASAGTRPADAVAAGAVRVAQRHGLRLDAAAPQALAAVAADTDLVVTVCDSAHEELGGSDIHWSIPDPVRVGSDEAFEAAFEELARRVNDLAGRVSSG